MKFWLILFFILILAACKTSGITLPDQNDQLGTIQTQKSSLPDLGQAPELTNDIWLNTSEPARLADLGGKVVLLEMWTFG